MSFLDREAGVTIAALGEHALISRLRARVPPPPAWVAVGIGDDAAVLDPPRGEVDIVTTDSVVEGIHFRREWTTMEAIGHKALAVNLSDLAAMGASPRAAVLSLVLPDDLTVAGFDALLEGFLALATAHLVPLVGGNISRSPGPIMVGVTLVGAARRRRVLLRSGARAGDELYVTGSLGAAAAGLAIHRHSHSPDVLSDDMRDCLDRADRPRPRLRYGIAVARNRAASACVDLSDGLADAATQLATASGVGVVIDAALVPVHPGVFAVQALASLPAGGLELALSGGEDYELLFAVPARRRSRFKAVARTMKDVVVTRIGRVVPEAGAWLERDGTRSPLGSGFSHF